ncbi:MAG: UDP-N-acetylmuramoylalanyl-D-glutamyl-2,6-diaminopimelate--D-alanyl-D-alanine ligase [Parvibaculaceae bacterium]|nr:UDP-N-acetylmuramoylalanyl-D-glutamyl-2,6-diaminopimelate--D-alanyl-D-alanine ligase [Parvibaculaceae bacterium]
MSTALWTAKEAALATNGKVGGDWIANGVSIDTRTLQPGDLFVALKGDHSDGHAHVEAALAKGAVAALVSQEVAGVAGEKLLHVDDTLAGLVALGRAARARTQAKVMAVTGSVGKTSTKEALLDIFKMQGRTHASVASYNNHWGVPLTLARMPADTEWAIYEIGMNHPGEILPLVKMVEPHAVMITNVEPVHLAQFDSVEQIADAKAEIFDGLLPGGAAVLNFDNPHFARLKARAVAAGVQRIVSFGVSDGADVHLARSALHPTCSCISAEICGQGMTYKLATPGQHVVMNSLGILGLVQAVGGDLAMAGMALASIQAPKGRGARHVVRAGDRQFLVIDESYNANPASVKAAFATLAQAHVEKGAHRIAVLGDMLELGADEIQMHRDLAGAIEAAEIDRVYACGPLMRALYEVLPANHQGGYAENSEMLLPLLARKLGQGDAVMIKGSFGSRMGLVVEGLLALSKVRSIESKGK